MKSTVDITTYLAALRSTVSRLATLVQGLAFWTAVLLPMVYLPPLLAGHPAVVDLSVLGKLIAVNVVAIAVGHRHGRETPGGG